MTRYPLISHLALLSLLLTADIATAAGNNNLLAPEGCLHGNGEAATVERKLAEFNMLETSGSFAVHIKAGSNEQQVKITGDANLLPLVITSLQGNKLLLYPQRAICTEMGITLDISIAGLDALVTNGSDSIKAQGIDSHRFALDMAGSSDVELTGRAITLDGTISGSGDLHAKNLKTKESLLNVSGSGTANVYATDRLKVEIVGISDVNYFGHPQKIEKEIIGAGNLNPMD